MLPNMLLVSLILVQVTNYQTTWSLNRRTDLLYRIQCYT